MTTSQKPLLLGGTLLTALLVALNLMVTNLMIRSMDNRVDLTEDKRFEIGQGTTNILSRLVDTMNVKCYFSGSLPQRLDHVQRTVVEKLQEYESAADGRFTYSFVDPDGAGDDSKAAKQECADLGIQPVKVEEYEGVVSSRLIDCYLAMVFRCGDQKSMLMLAEMGVDSLQDSVKFTADLEYFITTNIQKAASIRRTIGVVGDIQMVPSNPYDQRSEKVKTLGVQFLQQTLGRSYDVLLIDSKELNKEGAIPADVTTLVVHQPKAFTEVGIYKLDQFLMHGGNALFMIDSGSVDWNPKQKQTMMGNQAISDFDMPTYAGTTIDSGLNGFLEHLGVRVEPTFVIDRSAVVLPYVKDKQLKRNVFGQVMAEPVQDNKEYPTVIVVPARSAKGEILDHDQLNRERSMVARLSGLIFANASPITVVEENLRKHDDKDDAGRMIAARSERLVASGPDSWTQPVTDGVFSPLKAHDGEPAVKTPSTLMTMITGRFRSYFKDRDIPTETGPDGVAKAPTDEQVAGRLQEASKTSNIVFVGDADFIYDAWLQQIMQLEYAKSKNVDRARAKARATLALVTQAVDVLAQGGEGSDIIDIKNKRVRSREIAKMEGNDSLRRRLDLINFVGVPLLITALGVIRGIWRTSTTGARRPTGIKTEQGVSA